MEASLEEKVEHPCERFRKMQTAIYSNIHFYVLKVNDKDSCGRDYVRKIPYQTTECSNFFELLEKFKEDKTFIELKEVTIKEYAGAGGGKVPVCLKGCNYDGDWPYCMKKK